MINLNPKRSTVVVNLLIATVVSLTVNFSYLIAMVVYQRENSEEYLQRAINEREQDISREPKIEGVFHLSPDGYGYLVGKIDFSDPQKFREQQLVGDNREAETRQSQQGRRNNRSLPPNTANGGEEERHRHWEGNWLTTDSVFVNNRKVAQYNLSDGDTLRCTVNYPRNEKSHFILDDVLVQNGNEISSPITYDSPRRTHEMVLQLLFYMVLTFILLTLMTMKVGDKRFSSKRYLTRCSIVVLTTFALYFCAPFLNWRTGRMMFIFQNPPFMMLDWMVILKCTLVLVVAILYGRIYVQLLVQQQMQLENEQLRTENLQTRYNMLLSQISPHFFFNSLNSLAMLVRENRTESAEEYINQLSNTFRYIIQESNNNLTTLENELQFVESYKYLFEVRYAGKFKVNINVEENKREMLMPSLSMQLLIENAVKHNTITTIKPLTIDITTEGEQVVISNRIMPKLDGPEPGTGIGLKNLSSRYKLLMNKSVTILNDGVTFTVKLPLSRKEHKQ